MGTGPAALQYAADRAYAIVTGDFTGDGHTDLAVANYGSNDVSVFLGNGDGTFQNAVHLRGGERPGRDRGG